MADTPGHRRAPHGQLIADSDLFPPFRRPRWPPGPRELSARETALRDMPFRRPCRVSDPISSLDHRASYREAVLIVERGLTRVPMCVECAEVRQNPQGVVHFLGCYTAGADQCAECLRHSGWAGRWPCGLGGNIVETKEVLD